MNKAKHYCDNINCNHNDTKGLCCLFNPENCKYRQLQKENAELKEENQKWKDEWQEQVQKANDESYARTLQTIQLTKAKSLLKQWLQANICDSVVLFSETEQFLSEVEK